MTQHLLDSYNKYVGQLVAMEKELSANKKVGAEYSQFWVLVQELLDDSIACAFLTTFVLTISHSFLGGESRGFENIAC